MTRAESSLTLPRVAVPPLHGLRVTLQSPSPPSPDDLIERLYERLRANAARRFRTEEEQVAMGDDVICDLVVTVGGKPVPGGIRARVELEMRDYPLLPGLVEAVVGMSPLTQETLSVTLPAHYPAPGCAGKVAQVYLYIHEAYQVYQPEMDDPAALAAAGLGDCLSDAMAHLAREIDEEQGEQLLIQATQAALSEFGKLVKAPISEELIDSELLRVWEDSFEEVLVQSGFEEEQIEEAWHSFVEDPKLREECLIRIKTDAGLRALIDAQQLAPDIEEIDRLLESTAAALGVTRETAGRVVRDKPKLSKKLVDSSTHLRAVEFVIAHTHFTVLD